jgi:hypothetical protein
VASAKHRYQRWLLGRRGAVHDERSAVDFLRIVHSRLAPGPSCPGPLLTHEDGAFECHGTCRDGTDVHHDEDALAPCGYHAIPTRHSCPRCARDY